MSNQQQQQQSSLKQQADSFFQKQDYKKAIELYTQALVLDPSCEAAAALFSNRSLCHYKLDNFEEALKDGNAVVSINSKFRDGFLRIACAAHSLHKNEQAIDAFQKYFKMPLDDSVNQKQEKKDADEIAEIKQQYISLFKNHMEDTLLSSSSSSSSASTTATATTAPQQETINALGIDQYMEEGKFEEAVIIFTIAIDIDPSSEEAATAYTNRSLCYFRMASGDEEPNTKSIAKDNKKFYQQAYDDGTMASILRPQSAQAWLRKASSSVKLQKWEDADEAYTKYFELDKKNGSANAATSDKKNQNCRQQHLMVKKQVKRLKEEKEQNEAVFRRVRSAMSKMDRETKIRVATSMYEGGIPVNGQEPNLDYLKFAIENGADLRFTLFTVEPTPFGFPRRVPFPVLTAIIESNPSNLEDVKPIILYLIGEHVKQNIEVCATALTAACRWNGECMPDPDIILALLQTGFFPDVNKVDSRGTAPWEAVIGNSTPPSTESEVPPQVMECLRLLLSKTNANVNQAHECPSNGIKAVPLFYSKFAEITKVLIRHGADVNYRARRNYRDGTFHTTCPLNEAIYNLDRSTGSDKRGVENLRVLIGAGAQFVPDGKDGKSTSSIKNIFRGGCCSCGERDQLAYPCEDSLQLLLQQMQNQGLELTYTSTPNNKNNNLYEEVSLLFEAIQTGAPMRLIELLCARDPSAINKNGRQENGDFYHFPMARAVCVASRGVRSFKPATLNLIGLLLEHGADLRTPRFDDKKKGKQCATMLSDIIDELATHRFSLSAFLDVVCDKKGGDYVDECLKLSHPFMRSLPPY